MRFALIPVVAVLSLGARVQAAAPERLADAGRQPRLAVGADGAVAVVYGVPVDGPARGRIVCRVRAAGAKAFADPVDVATLAQPALGMRRGPEVAFSRSRLAVLAISHESGDLSAWWSDDAGRTWRGPSRVNDVKHSAVEGMDALAAGPDGTLLAVWLDGRTKGTKIWSARSADGGATWSRNVRVYASPDGHVCECCSPAVAADGAGFAVMFRNWLGGSRDMYLATSRDGGRTFAPARKLGEGTWPINACPMAGGWLTPDGLGGIETVWRREDRVYLCRPGESETEFAAGDQPWIARGSDGLTRVWLEQGSVRMAGPGGAPRVLGPGAWPVIAAGPAGIPLIAAWQLPGDAGGIALEDLP